MPAGDAHTDRSAEASATAMRRLARKLDPEPEHAFQVRHNALLLFDAFTNLHELGIRDRLILEGAALFHDIGYIHGPKGHHKTARDMILALELPGVPSGEQAMMGAVARYHRKSLPHPDHKVYRDLSPHEKRRVDRMAALLRIADGLDRAHAASVVSLRADWEKSACIVYVRQRRNNDLDIWGADRKRDLFEHAFQKQLRIVREKDSE